MIVEGMKIRGNFIRRVNKFLAIAKINGRATPCYLVDPGRLKELLLPGVEVIAKSVQNESMIMKSESVVRTTAGRLDRSSGGKKRRKTRYDLFAVVLRDKANEERLVSLDTRLPNKVVYEALLHQEVEELRGYDRITPEYNYGSSRLDFMLERGHGAHNEKCLLEVKGCNLVTDGVALFPDAPTRRGRKHLQELIKARQNGTCDRACILFIVQRNDAECIEPNDRTDPEFANALRSALSKGVKAYAYTTKITEEQMLLSKRIPINIRF